MSSEHPLHAVIAIVEWRMCIAPVYQLSVSPCYNVIIGKYQLVYPLKLRLQCSVERQTLNRDVNAAYLNSSAGVDKMLHQMKKAKKLSTVMKYFTPEPQNQSRYQSQSERRRTFIKVNQLANKIIQTLAVNAYSLNEEEEHEEEERVDNDSEDDE
ncbi:hypothetical protein HPULCUR_007466 [Helicostylum pulchrum]|uniref:Uncharacterized protein n=1 Tax=Helicostylum pulchrum TaxID=562976 RepID=A0ABP9Y4U4_9FUNG